MFVKRVAIKKNRKSLSYPPMKSTKLNNDLILKRIIEIEK
jgi:hypothetical protein